MPKIIEGAREKILITAKKRLFEKGYQHMSLREIAKESGIATGTIYNYFENKDYLIASIMLEDWMVSLEKMDAACDSESVKEGIHKICLALYDFGEIYRAIWNQPAVAATASMDMAARHKIISAQIEERVIRLLKNNGYCEEIRFTLSLSELILTSLYQEHLREELGEIAEHMYPVLYS